MKVRKNKKYNYINPIYLTHTLTDEDGETFSIVIKDISIINLGSTYSEKIKFALKGSSEIIKITMKNFDTAKKHYNIIVDKMSKVAEYESQK